MFYHTNKVRFITICVPRHDVSATSVLSYIAIEFTIYWPLTPKIDWAIWPFIKYDMRH